MLVCVFVFWFVGSKYDKPAHLFLAEQFLLQAEISAVEFKVTYSSHVEVKHPTKVSKFHELCLANQTVYPLM